MPSAILECGAENEISKQKACSEETVQLDVLAAAMSKDCDPRRSKPRVHLYSLCPEVLIHICSFATPRELSRMSACCHPLRSLMFVSDCVIWREHCLTLWRNKQGFRKFCDQFDIHLSLLASDAARNIVVVVGEDHDDSVSSGAKGAHCHIYQRPAAASRNAMATRPSVLLSPETTLRCIRDSILPPMTTAVSKSPMFQAGASREVGEDFALPNPVLSSPVSERRLWWELSPQEQVRRLRRLLCAKRNFQDDASSSSDDGSDPYGVTTAQGEEASGVSWKFAFFQSIRESKRSFLSKSDLLSAEWTISFSQIPGQTFPLLFREDGTLATPLHPGGLPYQLSQQGKELNVHVFPALEVARVTSDTASSSPRSDGVSSWGWRMKNHFVCIESRELPVPEYLQQLYLLCCPRPP